jgi:SAM-dependent methyltransferase
MLKAFTLFHSWQHPFIFIRSEQIIIKIAWHHNKRYFHMDERARREKERYNSNEIKRDNYTKILSRSPYSSKLIDDTITDRMKVADGANVLEIGSNVFIGYIVARGFKPSKLTCINISELELKLGTDFIANNKVAFPVEFKIMDANKLEFDDSQFDLVFGGAILHHLNFQTAIKEIHRVLKPDGHMMFHEPLGSNPIAKLIRFLTPFARTRDEKPLDRKDLEFVKEYFETKYAFFQLFSVFSTVLLKGIGLKDSHPLNKLFFFADTFITKHLPVLNPYFREILLSGRKRRTGGLRDGEAKGQ